MTLPTEFIIENLFLRMISLTEITENSCKFLNLEEKINLYEATYNFDSVFRVLVFPTLNVTIKPFKDDEFYVSREAIERFNPINIEILKTTTKDRLTVPNVKKILEKYGYRTLKSAVKDL